MIGIKRLRKKAMEYYQENDIKKTQQQAKKKLEQTDSLGFLSKYDQNQYEEETYYDDDFTYDTSSKNRNKTGAKTLYGIESEFVNYIKKQVYESKLKNKRGILISCHRFNEREKVFQILRLIKAGLKVVLVSDAGSPCLSDPGQVLVNEAIKSNVLIHSLPGPNAISISLISSGFPSDKFQFLGYLSKNQKELKETLEKAKKDKLTFLLFENKNRLITTLLFIEQIFGSQQMVYIGVELTKLHERHLRGTVGKIYDTLNNNPDYTIPSLKGEITIVVASHIYEFNKGIILEQKNGVNLDKEDDIDQTFNIKIKNLIELLQDNVEIGHNNLSVFISKLLNISKKRAYKIITNLKKENEKFKQFKKNQNYQNMNNQLQKFSGSCKSSSESSSSSSLDYSPKTSI